jgi:mRNA interferase RelE/StbE
MLITRKVLSIWLIGYMMKINFSRSAFKFLDKVTAQEKVRIRRKIRSLASAIDEGNRIPFKELDIRKLSGEWAGYFRMRT